MKGRHFFRRLCAVVTGFMLIANSSFAYADDNLSNDSDYETVMVVGVTASGTFGDNLEWKLYSNGEFEIATTSSGTGIIPDFLEQADIPWRDYQNEIKSVEIFDGVTRIGGASFSYCENLSKVIIPDTVSEIGESAFFKCQSLQSITIPESVQSIGRYCFWNCSQLSCIRFMNPECKIYDDAQTICSSIDYTTGKAVFDGTITMNDISLDNAVGRYAEKYSYKVHIGGKQCGDNAVWAFDDATGTLTISGTGNMRDYTNGDSSPWYPLKDSIKEVMIENGITSIGKLTFFNCENLTDLTLPESVTKIGYAAFTQCYNLTSVNISENVTSIDNYGFSYCTSLISIEIPDKVENIGYNAFYNCTSLENITISNPSCKIYDNGNTIPSTATICGYKGSVVQDYAKKFGRTFIALDSSGETTNIAISGECGENAIWDFDESTGTITISGDGDIRISGDSPWHHLKDNITEVVIENGITSIGSNAFNQCGNLKTISMPNNLNTIGSIAFCNCENLTDLTLPESVTEIGRYAFMSCSNLISVNIPENVEFIRMQTFDNCGKLENIVINNPECKIYDREDTISDTATIYGYANSTAQAYAEKYSRTFIALDAPEETTTSSASATTTVTTSTTTKSTTTALTTTTATTTVATAGQCGDYATWSFDETTGTLTISGIGKITDVSWNYHMNNIKKVIIENGITNIKNHAFFDCNLENITIPDSVTNIENGAFRWCSKLEDITIPKGVKSIGDYAFVDCYNLRHITIMNPECEIYSDKDTIPDTATIYGYKDSTAQAYAKEYSKKFLALDAPEETTTSSAPATTTISTTTQPATTKKLTTSADTTTTEQTTTSTSTTSATTEPTTTTTTVTTEPTTTITSTTTETTTATVTTNRAFMHAADAWSFGNVEKNFIDINTNRYFLLPEHAEKLSNILAWKEKYRLEKIIGDVNYTKGACYGMSVLTMLSYCNVISPSDIQEGANFISDITLTDNVKSAVNYHHLLQLSEPIFNEIKSFHYYDNKERVEKLLEKIRQKPTVIFIRNDYKKPDGEEYHFQHVVLGYEVSSGVYQYENKVYDKKISLYDPKKNEYSKDRNLYINSSTGDWIIPAYPASYESSSNDPARKFSIAGAINDTNILSANSLFTDNADTSVQKLYHPDMLVSTSSDGSLERIKQGGLLFGEGEDEDDIVEGFSFANGDSDSNLKSYYMRYSDASYQFCFNDDKYDYAGLDMRYEHTLTDIEVKYLNKAVFSPESVKIKALNSDYTIHNIHDIQQSTDEFYRLDIQGKNACELELSYEAGYWTLSFDTGSLGMLRITGTNTSGTAEKVFSTSADTIKIYAEDESTVGIMTDEDNDGVFESYFTDNVINGDVNSDGTIDATDASEILAEYSRLSTGHSTTFTDEQSEAADIDFDGVTGASDASLILSFFSYLSTGGTETDMIKWILNQ